MEATQQQEQHDEEEINNDGQQEKMSKHSRSNENRAIRSTRRSTSAAAAAAAALYTTVVQQHHDENDEHGHEHDDHSHHDAEINHDVHYTYYNNTRSSIHNGGNHRQRTVLRFSLAINIALTLSVIVLLVYTYRHDDHDETISTTTTTSTATAASNNSSDSSSSSSSSSLFRQQLEWKALPTDAAAATATSTHTGSLTRIAFGSCSSQNMPQPYWDTLVSFYQPDLLLMMGDNVYGDCHALPDEYYSINNNSSNNNNNSIENMDNIIQQACQPLLEAYQNFAKHPSFQAAIRQIPIFATLDDHDYGMSSANQNNPYKHYARQLFANFFQIPLQELPTNNDGVYRSRVFAGGSNNKGSSDQNMKLQVILLDTRYGKSPFLRTGNQSAPFQPFDNDYNNKNNNTNYQMLSKQQWGWLQQQLLVEADLRLIVSSIQVLNDGTGFECWRHMPAERVRLIEMVRGKNVLFLSGDRHVGGFYHYSPLLKNNHTDDIDEENGDHDIGGGDDDGDQLGLLPLQHVLPEITASSWTHTQPFGAFNDCASASECDEDDPRRDGDFVRINHFGTIDIDWEQRTVMVALRRAEASFGSPYRIPGYYRLKKSDAGEIIVARNYSFANN